MESDIYNSYHKIGLDKLKLVKLLEGISKMAYEQFFMLAIYSRQELLHNKNSVRERLSFVNIVLNERDLSQERREKLLSLLKGGKSSVDIIKALNDNERSEKNILRELSEEKIAFPNLKNDVIIHYDFIYMHFSIMRPIEVLSVLEGFDKFKQNIDDYVLNKLNNYLLKNRRSEGKPPNLDGNKSLLKYFSESYTLEMAIDFLFKDNFNHKSFVISFYDEFASEIAKILSMAWSLLSSISGSSAPHTINDWAKIAKVDDESISLLIHKDTFQGLLDIGQGIAASQYIQSILVQRLTPTSNSNQVMVNARKALEQIVVWQHGARTELVKRIDQIPRLIASLIYCDLYYKLGEIGKICPYLTYKETQKNYYRLTSIIIRHCFINQLEGDENDYWVKLGCNSSYSLVESVPVGTRYSIEVIESKVFDKKYDNSRSLIMETWAEPLVSLSGNDDKLIENKKLFDKYKKLPHYLRPYGKQGCIELIESIILKHRHVSKTSGSYPIGSDFPMPLWF